MTTGDQGQAPKDGKSYMVDRDDQDRGELNMESETAKTQAEVKERIAEVAELGSKLMLQGRASEFRRLLDAKVTDAKMADLIYDLAEKGYRYQAFGVC